MSVYSSISKLHSTPIDNLTDAEDFLKKFSPKEQKQLMTVFMLGTRLVGYDTLREDILMTTGILDTYKADEYARLLFEKALNKDMYLDNITRCADASGFDLNQI